MKIAESFVHYYKYLSINNILKAASVHQHSKLQYKNYNTNSIVLEYRMNQVQKLNKSLFIIYNTPLISNIRNKYTKGSKTEEDSDSDDEPDNFKDEKDSKIIRTRVNSLRADLIVKAGLGIARNKVETIFYESKIRVNGKKLPKKSIQLAIGDEIDVIKGFSDVNPSHLVVSRVVILSATEKEENLLVNMRRFKSLLVDNYEGVNLFKSSD